MKFCEICHNMLYISVEKDNDLKHYCKNCNFNIIENYSTKTECVLETTNENNNTVYQKFMSKYIKFDPTLPRVNNIDCPSCTVKPNKVIYVKYDHKNMKFLYYCCNCEHFWI